MKAIVCEQYGPPEVLEMKEVETPAPKDNEILIKIHATSVTAGDVIMRNAKFPHIYKFLARLFFGFTKPKKPIPGMEMSGEVEAVGKDVTRFKQDDQVYGETGFGAGTYAEYVCLPADGAIALKPKNLTWEEAAAVPVGALTALFFLRKQGEIKSGEKVLIYGASGSVGTYAVQLAKHFGAEVTAVCSTANVEMVKSLGADAVVDYTKEDYTETNTKYDIVFDTVGYSSFDGNIRLLKKNGRLLLSAVWKLSWYFRGMRIGMMGGIKVKTGVTKTSHEDLSFLGELIEAGKMKPVIDKRYSLDEVVEAHRYAETKRKRGNVVVTVRHDDN